ncbi:unnamed protein product [Rhizoctonia solani]|uniref:Protein kinase domain-containing protein n=1 Tax=Rhizoctonia solani TaxID=456999 RepID=A0A8H3E8W2_9AGAM|nr:unnamed protein product [Rhizoctonia solani]
MYQYLERTTPRPRHIQMMTDTLRGLAYMHDFKSGPIAHGDVKLSNILVTANEIAMICDFGRSLQPHDQPNEAHISNSSPFVGTVRYMSPELFVPNAARPTPAADMWAYGCVALEILCRITPYHQTTSDIVIAELIKNGSLPSERPRGPRGSLINDKLWNVLSSCWRAQDWRPTAHIFMEQLTLLLQSGEVPRSPVQSNMFPRVISGPMPPWPSELDDLNDLLGEKNQTASSIRSTVWMTTLSSSQVNRIVVVKVPRLNASTQNQARHDHLRYILRRVVANRYGVRHPNIVDLLGVASGFSPHEGLVFEYCSHRNLVVYFKENWVRQTEYARPPAPEANAYSLMCDILEGLKYMHSYPVPIPQGDLTPENILVGFDGRAKISLFSFGRVLASLPSAAGVTASIGSIIALRWMSPELSRDDQQPSTESDMWTILTGLEPYTSHRRDDFAGAESMRGQPPGSLASVDYSRAWITNGVWGTIGKCWRREPLLRPSAGEFLKVLKALEGRKLSWLPLNVTDLTGKVKLHPGQRQPESQLAVYTSMWKRFRYEGKELDEDVQLKMVVYRTTYTPKWYSKATPVAIKVGSFSELDQQALVTSIRREITVMAQIDHPGIQKLLGIDSSNIHMPEMVLEFDSGTTFDLVLSQGNRTTHECARVLSDLINAIVYLHEHENGAIAHGDIHPENVLVLPDGTAKLTNFTCSFQYVNGQPTSPNILSTTISTPQRPTVYCDPGSYWQIDGTGLVLPTLAGDIWSFGVVALSSYSDKFLHKNHNDHLSKGRLPLDLEEYSELDERMITLLRPMLVPEPANRPSARTVSEHVLKFL